MSLPPTSEELAATALFKAIAHPMRLRVLRLLAEAGSLSVGELMAQTGVEQSSLSHQLSRLREARLVAASRDGKRVRYVLHDRHVMHIIEDALLHVAEDPEDNP